MQEKHYPEQENDKTTLDIIAKKDARIKELEEKLNQIYKLIEGFYKQKGEKEPHQILSDVENIISQKRYL